MSLTDIIKARITGSTVTSKVSAHATSRKLGTFDLAKAVTSKVEDGNIRLLSSDDRPADSSDAVFAAMQTRHPPAASGRTAVPDPCTLISLQVTESEVLKAIRSFPAGSSGGPDGFRPQHLLELVTCQSNGASLLSALTGFVNMVLDGGCPASVCPIFFGAKLIALEKKCGGYRPIAIGYTLRRLVAKCANIYAQKKLADYFAPLQLGVAASGGCEAAVHATRRFLDTMANDDVIVKLDFNNAFNTVRRDAVLNSVAEKVPEVYRFCHSAYAGSSHLQFGDHVITSAEGVQQGDPLGPLLFCLTLQPVLSSLSSKLRIGYLDYVTLGGPMADVENDVNVVVDSGKAIGLTLNSSKCEIISQSIIPPGLSVSSFCQVSPSDSILLGAPLLCGSALDAALSSRCSELATAESRLSIISAHDALLLLKSSLSTPKLQHLLRSSPCAGHTSLTTIDDTLRRCVSRITNCDISETQWTQASLPVKSGGLGIRRATQLAPSAYLAAFCATSELQARILNASNLPMGAYENAASAVWTDLTAASALPNPSAYK